MELNFNGNKLAHLPTSLCNLKTLKKLNFGGNMKVIDLQFILDISGSPFHFLSFLLYFLTPHFPSRFFQDPGCDFGGPNVSSVNRSPPKYEHFGSFELEYYQSSFQLGFDFPLLQFFESKAKKIYPISFFHLSFKGN